MAKPKEVFELTPTYQGRRVRYQEAADRLKYENPGEWAKVIACDTPQKAWAHVGNINRGRKQAFRPQGEWEASARGRNVYVRYTGPVQRRLRKVGGND